MTTDTKEHTPMSTTARPTGLVRTVLGDLDPGELGHTQTHEHLVSDMSAIIQPWGLAAVGGGSADTIPAARRGEMPATARGATRVPIRPDTYDRIRRDVINFDNLQMLDEGVAIEEMGLYRAAGGGAVVDCTPIGMARDPLALARISRATGVHVVMGAGYYVHDFHPPGCDQLTEEEIEAQIVRDVQVGVGTTGLRSGIIGEIGLSWPALPCEERSLRAAARAQQATGAPLQIHPGRHPEAPPQIIRTVTEAGGDPTRTIMCHIDRTLNRVEDMLELAATGCYLEFDLFGQESSYYAPDPHAVRPNDGTRIDWLIALADGGHADRLLIAQDICQKVYLRRYGGPGYTHILEAALPLMRLKGMSEELIEMITRSNPGAVLSFR
jgi:phosphotriesterase-related protein